VVVEVDGAGRLTLRDAADFRAFKVVTGGDPWPRDGASARLRPATDGEVFVPVELVRDLAGPLAADDGWRRGLAAMVEFARQHGWLDADGTAIRAHVERDPR
jgi:hypothetical protein